MLWQNSIAGYTHCSETARDATFRSITALSVRAPFGVVPEAHLSAAMCLRLHLLHHEMLSLEEILHASHALKDH